MKKLILIAAVVLLAAGCKPHHPLTEGAEDMLIEFDGVANSYHWEMGHNTLNEAFGDKCQFALDYQKQRDTLEARLIRIDASNGFWTQQRLQALAEAVAHLGRTARWDTGARGPCYAALKFRTDAGWKIYFKKICREKLGSEKYYGKF